MVDGGGLGPVGEPGGGPAVVARADRRRRRLVQDVPDHTAREPEPGAVGFEQAGTERPLRPADGVADADVGDVGHEVEVCPGAHHRRHSEELVHVPTGAGDAFLHGVTEGLGLRVPVASHRQPEGFDHELRVAAGAFEQVRHVDVACLESSGQLLDRGQCQRAQRQLLDHPAEEGKDVGHPVGRHGGDDQHRFVAQPVGEEVQRGDGGFPGVVEVVEEEEHGLLVRQALQEADDGFQRPPVLELGGRPLVVLGGQEGTELGHQLGERAGPLPRQHLQALGGHGVQETAQRVEHRLEEQRPLGLVTCAPQNHRARGACPLGDLRHQPGLA
jgi:hypothetical protein